MKHMLKQNKVKVLDTEGRTHVMTRANATDMVQHAGWTVVFDQPPPEPEDMTLPHAPRSIRPVHELAQEQIANARGVNSQRGQGTLAKAKAALQARTEDGDGEEEAPSASAGKKSRKAAVRAPANENEGEEAVAAVMPAVNAHALAQHNLLADLDLDALEREEHAREPKGE